KSIAKKDNFDDNQFIAQCYYSKSEYSEALKYYEITLDILDSEKKTNLSTNETKAILLFSQALCNFLLNQFNKVRELCNLVIYFDPSYANAYNLRGYSYCELEKFEVALDDLQFCPKLGNEDIELRKYLNLAKGQVTNIFYEFLTEIKI